jgi:hypothetical protein
VRGKAPTRLPFFFFFFFEREAFLFIPPPPPLFLVRRKSSPAWVYFDHLDGRNDLGLSLPSSSSLVFNSSFGLLWWVAVAETISHEVGHMLRPWSRRRVALQPILPWAHGRRS